MGCSDCANGTGGCDGRKHVQRALLDDIVARVYPDRTWGQPDDEARFRAGVPRAEVRRLRGALSVACEAPAFFVPGADEDLCDFVWLLCVGRRPTLLEAREGLADLGDEARSPDRGEGLHETWLRVAFSTVARIAALQEVRLALAPGDDGADVDGPAVLRETARPGVFDPVLLKRVRKAVTLLEASDIAHVDFGLLEAPLEGADASRYEERYGLAPQLWSYLFQAAPATTERHTPLMPGADLAAAR